MSFSWRRVIAFLALCSIASCGGGGGGGGGTGSGLTVSALAVNENGAYTGSNPGTVTITGTVAISGSGATQLSIGLINGTGSTVGSASGPISGGGGSGTVSFSAQFNVASLPAGAYEIEVQVATTSGAGSNLVSTPFTMVAYPWTTLTAMPISVVQFGTAAVGSKIYVVSGLTASGSATETGNLQILDTTTNTWTMGPVEPTARAGATVVAVGTKIYVMGGYNATSPSGITSVDVFDTVAGTWSIGPSSPTARFFSCGVAIGTKIYLTSGTQSSTELPNISTLEALDTSNSTWSTLTGGAGPARPACAALNGLMYVTGGETQPPPFGELTSSSTYNASSDAWTSLNLMPWNLSRHASIAVNGHIYTFGGQSDTGGVDGPVNVSQALDPSSGSWSAKAPLPLAAADLGAVAVGSVIYVVGPNATYVYQAALDTL